MTREGLRALAGGSTVNEEYLMDLIIGSIKPAYIKTLLKIDTKANQEKIDTLIQEGIIEEKTIETLDCLMVNWHLPYLANEPHMEDELRAKCLEASDLVDRKNRADEILSRIKFLYGGEE